MFLKIFWISVLLFFYFLFYFVHQSHYRIYIWCKVIGLTISTYIYLCVLNNIYQFKNFSTKFQYIDQFKFSFQIWEFRIIDLWTRFEFLGLSPSFLKQFSFFDWLMSPSVKVYYGLDGISIVFLLLVSLIIPIVILVNWEQQSCFFLNNILFLEICLLHLFTVLDFFFFFFFLWSKFNSNVFYYWSLWFKIT